MKKILVLGGTRFFGKKLVERLTKAGHEVTIVTRGKSEVPFDSHVSHIKVDRLDEAAFRGALEGQWDLVYDNICYSPNEAKVLCEILEGKTQKLIFTSTLSTYEIDGRVKKEEDFDPFHYEIKMGDQTEFSYGEGKRQAEAVFFKYASFPVVAVRFPIVMGEDDYTRRLHFHTEKVKKEEAMSFINMDAKMSFILAAEAAEFLEWAGFSDIEGPFNATAKGSISLRDLLSLVENATGKQAIITLEEDNTVEKSPYAIPNDWYMTPEKAEKAGFEFSELSSWLPELVAKIAK